VFGIHVKLFRLLVERFIYIMFPYSCDIKDAVTGVSIIVTIVVQRKVCVCRVTRLTDVRRHLTK
jgi:hypothetical protein